MVKLADKFINTEFYNSLHWNKCTIKRRDNTEERLFATLESPVNLEFVRTYTEKDIETKKIQWVEMKNNLELKSGDKLIKTGNGDLIPCYKEVFNDCYKII